MSVDTEVPKILTMVEVAALAHLPLATLRFYRHQGIGPTSFKLGRRVVYRESDVAAWINEQRAEPPKERPSASTSTVLTSEQRAEVQRIVDERLVAALASADFRGAYKA